MAQRAHPQIGHLDERGSPAMVWLAYRTATRHLGLVLLPAVGVLIPVAVAVVTTATVLIGDNALLVNGDIAVLDIPGVPYLVWLVVLAAIALLGGTLAGSAVMIIIAGVLLDRPVAAGAALRAALRRLPTVGGLTVAIGLAATAVVAAGAVLHGRYGWADWLSVALAGSLLLFGLPCLAALPAAVLERHGVFRALGRAWQVTRDRRLVTRVDLLLGVLLVPALAAFAASLAARQLDGLAHTLAEQTLRTVTGILAVPFAAATLTVVFLSRWRPHRDSHHADRERILANLPARTQVVPTGDPSPAMPAHATLPAGAAVSARAMVLLVAALALPGLLHTGYAWANPLRLPTVTDRVLLTDAGGYTGQPPLLHHAGGGQVIALHASPRHQAPAAVSCEDLDCRHNQPLRHSFFPRAPQFDTAALPDGRVAVAAWRAGGRGATAPADDPHRLLLGTCDTERCQVPEVASAPTIAEATGIDRALAAAVASTPDGAIAVAHLARAQLPDDQVGFALSLTRCDDPRCAAPETAVLSRELPGFVHGPASRPLDVAVTPDGRPIVAYLGKAGGVTLARCDSPQCQDPGLTTLVPGPPDGTSPAAGETHDQLGGIEIAVPPDGRPVLAFRDPATGTAQLLQCHTAACRTAENTRLVDAPPGRSLPAPALALDQHGQPVIATYQLTHNGVADRLVLTFCAGTGCDEREAVPVASAEHGAGRLDLAVTPDGRPQILWADTRSAQYGLPPHHLRLTTCAAPDCR